jgi:hypothetical protein
MSDESTAGTLVLVGAILQLIFSIVFLLIGGLGFLAMLFLFEVMDLFEILWIVLIPLILLIGGGISLIFTILWFNWRSHPSAHKTGLIVTGILGLIFGGFLAGLLVLIGGAIAPSTESA